MTSQPVHRYVPQWTPADRLRRVRRDAGLDQADFAERLGLKQQRYSAWEAGRNNPPMTEFVTVAKRIELAFGVPAAWLLGLDVDEPSGPTGGGNGVTREYRNSVTQIMKKRQRETDFRPTLSEPLRKVS